MVTWVVAHNTADGRYQLACWLHRVPQTGDKPLVVLTADPVLGPEQLMLVCKQLTNMHVEPVFATLRPGKPNDG